MTSSQSASEPLHLPRGHPSDTKRASSDIHRLSTPAESTRSASHPRPRTTSAKVATSRIAQTTGPATPIALLLKAALGPSDSSSTSCIRSSHMSPVLRPTLPPLSSFAPRLDEPPWLAKLWTPGGDKSIRSTASTCTLSGDATHPQRVIQQTPGHPRHDQRHGTSATSVAPIQQTQTGSRFQRRGTSPFRRSAATTAAPRQYAKPSHKARTSSRESHLSSSTEYASSNKSQISDKTAPLPETTGAGQGAEAGAASCDQRDSNTYTHSRANADPTQADRRPKQGTRMHPYTTVGRQAAGMGLRPGYDRDGVVYPYGATVSVYIPEQSTYCYNPYREYREYVLRGGANANATRGRTSRQVQNHVIGDAETKPGANRAQSLHTVPSQDSHPIPHSGAAKGQEPPAVVTSETFVLLREDVNDLKHCQDGSGHTPMTRGWVTHSASDLARIQRSGQEEAPNGSPKLSYGYDQTHRSHDHGNDYTETGNDVPKSATVLGSGAKSLPDYVNRPTRGSASVHLNDRNCNYSDTRQEALPCEHAGHDGHGSESSASPMAVDELRPGTDDEMMVSSAGEVDSIGDGSDREYAPSAAVRRQVKTSCQARPGEEGDSGLIASRLSRRMGFRHQDLIGDEQSVQGDEMSKESSPEIVCISGPVYHHVQEGDANNSNYASGHFQSHSQPEHHRPPIGYLERFDQGPKPMHELELTIEPEQELDQDQEQQFCSSSGSGSGTEDLAQPPKKRVYARRDTQRRKEQNAEAQKKFRWKKKVLAEQMRSDLTSLRREHEDLVAKNEILTSAMLEKDHLLNRLLNENGTLKRQMEVLERKCMCGAEDQGPMVERDAEARGIHAGGRPMDL